MKKLVAGVGLSAALLSGCSSPESPAIPPFAATTTAPKEAKIPVRPLYFPESLFGQPNFKDPKNPQLGESYVPKGDVVDGVCIASVQGSSELDTRVRTMLRVERNGQALGYVGIVGQLDGGKDNPYVDMWSVGYDELVAKLPECGPIATNLSET